MTESTILFKNWKYKDIIFKDLIDLGFPLPQYQLYDDKFYDVKAFKVGGLYAVDYGSSGNSLESKEIQ